MDKLIVIDASAVLSLLLNEPMAAKVLNLTIEARLISPASLPYEIANALSARVKANNQTILSKEYAMKAYALYQAMPIELVAILISYFILKCLIWLQHNGCILMMRICYY